MVAAVSTKAPIRRVSIKQVALPVEHGGWSFLFEPLVAGLAIAFSFAGSWIAFMMIGAFLLRRPLSVFAAQAAAGRNNEYRSMSAMFAFAFAILFIIGFIGSVIFANAAHLLPLAVLPPLGLYQLYCDVYRQNRRLLPEIAGAVAMSASAASIILAGTRDLSLAAAVWFFLAARLIASIVYVRNRLDLEKGKQYSFAVPIFVHEIGLLGVAVLAVAGKLPYLAVAAFVVLTIRAILGLSRYRTPAKAIRIGILEVTFGVASLAGLLVGYHAGI